MQLFHRVIRPAAIVSVLGLALLPAAAKAQEMILEAEPGTESLASCDSAHNIKTCGSVHIETEVALAIGSILRLDGRIYVITWMGPGYYLGNGLVVEPTGRLQADLKGQGWVEVKPREGRTHTSRGWQDADRNRALSTSDTLALDDGPEVVVKDIRLHVRVIPAPEAKEAETE
jgi:hypothetical protein